MVGENTLRYKVVNWILRFVLLLAALCCLLPILNTVAISFSSKSFVNDDGVANVHGTGQDQSPERIDQTKRTDNDIPGNGATGKEHAENDDAHVMTTCGENAVAFAQGIGHEHGQKHIDRCAYNNLHDRGKEGTEELLIFQNLLIRGQGKAFGPEDNIIA